jgi:DNA-binding transcriptional LysR family regulator
MDLRQLRYFTTLADTLNFHRAAERLHMSQPPLTVAIRKLEEELGIRLFIRETRGVRLTEAGRAALPVARAALEQAGRVRAAATHAKLGESGTIAVGFVGSAISVVLPRIVPAFRARFPHVDLRLEEMTSVSVGEALMAGQLDVGLVRLPMMRPEALDISVIERDRLAVAVSDTHPLARQSVVALPELASEPLLLHGPVSVLRTVVLLACQHAGFTPRIAQEATQVPTLLSLVQSGLGLALVPASMAPIAPKGVVLVPLAEPVEIEMGVACRRDAGPLVENFVAVARAPADTQSISPRTK